SMTVPFARRLRRFQYRRDETVWMHPLCCDRCDQQRVTTFAQSAENGLPGASGIFSCDEPIDTLGVRPAGQNHVGGMPGGTVVLMEQPASPGDLCQHRIG